jgi:hypothetical protein
VEGKCAATGWMHVWKKERKIHVGLVFYLREKAWPVVIRM